MLKIILSLIVGTFSITTLAVEPIKVAIIDSGFTPLPFDTAGLKLYKILRRLTKRGVKIFAAAGNANKDLNKYCNSYPACYKHLGRNMVVVGALDEDLDVAKYSNYGAKLSVYRYGRTHTGARGTSFAAPRAAGDYVKSIGK